ncbi:choline/ethanolamine kinase family protein [Pararhizobium sp. IMCC21322]|uniref:choline/ethanolamine kinase family protein n=1 Tax=Pararhizobium sp. IMCC21322 TaxID=3067903 RepID=UPI0027417F22|nr:choline/ethanolamine kinase family protein [Pararhizobium sp. IMCC21322]
MSEFTESVQQALRNVPRLSNVTLVDSQLVRLGGLTNVVHRVDLANETLIVRIPGKGTEEYIDRAVELNNAHAAALAGVSAEVIWGDANSGIMVSRCIENIVTMTPETFKERPGAPERAALAFRKLHQSGEEFQFRFELFSMIEDYLKVLSGKDAELPEGYSEIVEAAEPVKTVLSENESALAPCHCDPLCENFLDDGTLMWIVDWEYSGMNDPMWDLGDLSVEAGFTAEQDRAMMDAYFDGQASDAEFGRMVVYKAMCDLLWTLWGLIQHADKNPADDFWAYSVNRFERCKTLMRSAEFEAHLNAIRAG